jgi:hypothetical protein
MEQFAGLVREIAERGGDFFMATVTEQADGGVSERRQIVGSVATLDLALIFAESHVAHPMVAFQAPMGSPAVQQQGRVAGAACKAGDGVLQLDRGLALADGRAFQAADLSQTGPVQMFGQTSAGLKMALFPPSMPLVRRAGFSQRPLSLLLGSGGKIPAEIPLRSRPSARVGCL